ncbi:Mitochondrial metalloendopeptidase OMA1 [Spatholobus suberectus]|nr:Mitochondrial metalloendopeptidase OMA1 [Spatholobus suberectus]
MGWYRRGKLALDRFRSLASRDAPQNPNFQRGSRICRSGYLNSDSKGASFNGFSLFYSISLGDVVGVNRNFHNPILLRTKRFYYWFQNIIRVFIVVLAGLGVFATVYYRKLGTVPFTKRTQLIVFPDDEETSLNEKQFEEKMSRREWEILPPTHPESVRVRMIAKDIIDALQRGLRKEQYALAESEEKAEGSWHKEDDKWVQQGQIKGQERGSQAATSHLDGLNWEIFVVNKPVANASYFLGGKRGCLTYSIYMDILVNYVGHAVARHHDGQDTIESLLEILQWILILYQFVSPGIAKRMHSLFLLLMSSFCTSGIISFSRRGEIEADYIGLQLSASAGYDPQVAPNVQEKLGKINGTYYISTEYLATHPSGRKRAAFLAQAKIMEEAVTIYRDARVGKTSGVSKESLGRSRV